MGGISNSRLIIDSCNWPEAPEGAVGGGGGTSLQEANGDVPLYGVEFSPLD